jgi:cation diffusion facilitator CzcD-associated flavoprotein CzcO
MASESTFQFEEHSIDEPRPIRIIVIGGGPCGIISAIRLHQRIKNVSIQIYDKNGDFGGTWHQHRYPGVGSDIPVLSYQLTFEPNREWTKIYPSGAEIGEYWKNVARKYRLYKYAKFNHRLTHAKWDGDTGKWRFTIEDLGSGKTLQDEGDFFFSCMGQFNNWKWPDIQDRELYKGTIMHSADWDETYNFHQKRIALIGSGSSAVQILPQLQPIVNHLDAYIRNQMWISPRFGASYIAQNNPELVETNFKLTEGLRKQFSEDEEFYLKYRKGMETHFNSIHGFTLLDHPVQEMFRNFLINDMQEKLAKRPDILAKLVPTFPAGCRRVTPGNGFLEALIEDNVTFKPEHIARFTETGIATEDGAVYEYDAIICATGYDCSFRPPFPIIGENSIDLRDKFNDTPQSYLSVAVDEFPNMMIIGGPNSEVGTSHSMIVFEKVADYAVKCVQKAQFEHIKSMVPSAHATKEFMKYVTTYFTNNRTVYGEKCRSTYRNGGTEGPSTALWPGSVLHLIRTLKEPRWQDYEYEYFNGSSMFGYLGDGWTEVERNGGDTAYYLDAVDFPPVPIDET